MNRKLEIFSGAYASGKSETSINRALQYVKQRKKITLVDLDTVEPAYCLRPIIPKLEKMGLNIIAQRDYFGLGEAASYINHEQIHCLKNDGNIVIDVGYGASGLDILDLIEGIENEQNLDIYLVVNTSKFETKYKNSILEYLKFASGLNEKPWKKFTGFISNTHFAQDTTKDDIINGYNILKEVEEESGIKIIAIGVPDFLSNQFDKSYDNIPIWIYKRMMHEALW